MNKDELIKLLEDTIIPASCTDMTPYLQPIADALMEVMPVPLYRFRTINEYSLSAFDKDLIFFSRAKDFNDPYDSLLTAPSLESFLSLDSKDQFSLMSICQNLLIKGYEIPECVKNVIPLDLLKSLVTSLKDKSMGVCNGNDMIQLKRIVEDLQNRVRFFEVEARNCNSFACFSEDITSLTMWAHYADYHKGYALSYDLKPLIKQPSGGIMVLPIIYSSQRYDATNFLASCLGMNTDIPVKRLDVLDVIKSTLHKSPAWSYEKEWRLINTIDMNSPHPSLDYSPSGIYYGTQISEINKKILHAIAVEKGIKEFEMYIDKSSYGYKMKIRPFSV